ncbi:MAG: CAP domain-containing protein [Campylobacterota bacterium]|nr:CAP domain-containing protein [Campylobacterota bacterium]
MIKIFKVLLLVSLIALGLNASVKRVSSGYIQINSGNTTFVGNSSDQTYSINPLIVTTASAIVIIDKGGSNTIELVGGLTISSSIVVSNEILLTLSDGSTLNIRGANSFTFDVGANQSQSIAGTHQSFSEFVTTTLGLSAVPTLGQVPVSGGAVDEIIDGGGSAGAITYDITDEIVDIVNAHNWYRANVYTGYLLTWDDDLAQDAQDWAEYLAANFTDEDLAAGRAPHASMFEPELHEFDKFQGENIYITTNSPAVNMMVTAIEAFGDEVADYNYEDNSCDLGKICGHYTQVVWQDTSTVGCAEVQLGPDISYNTVVVCRYYAPGNYIGQKPY